MNFKAFKSTVLGLLLIAVAIYAWLAGVSSDYWLIGGFGVSGILLLFTGDRFINKLERVVFGKVLFNKKDQD